LIQLFGENGLVRIEKLEAVELERRAEKAKVIDGETVEIVQDAQCDDTPDPRKLIALARQTLSSAERRPKFQRIDFLGTTYWYRSQLAFFAAGSSGVHQRLIYGGNQTGKTICCGAEVVWHITGDYPDWWAGLRFNHAIDCWVIGESTVLVRDTLQRHLCGGENFGTGLVPLEAFCRKPIMVSGGLGAVDTFFVTHRTNGKVDGTSRVTFKSFEQRRERLQSCSIHLIWVDERPEEQVYSQPLARTTATNGHLILSYTPIGAGGAAGLTYKFLSEPSADRAVFRITSQEAKHISEARRDELGESYGEAERETRLEGTPQLGAGPVFPIELLPTMVRAIKSEEISSWARRVVGIDFGFGHPFAACYVAWADDTGQIWVIDSFRMER